MPEAAWSLFGSLVTRLVESLDSAVKSPPPDEHDTVVVVTEKMPTVNVPIPDDPNLRTAFYEALGQRGDQQRVNEFLRRVGEHKRQQTPNPPVAVRNSTSVRSRAPA